MSRRGYDIYRKMHHGWFTWVVAEPSRSQTVKTLERLSQETTDGSNYLAIAKASPSLLVMVPRRRFT